MVISRNDTAIVFIHPQTEVLSEQGAAWALLARAMLPTDAVVDALA